MTYTVSGGAHSLTSMRDLICDVIKYGVWSCDMGKILWIWCNRNWELEKKIKNTPNNPLLLLLLLSLTYNDSERQTTDGIQTN